MADLGDLSAMSGTRHEVFRRQFDLLILGSLLRSVEAELAASVPSRLRARRIRNLHREAERLRALMTQVDAPRRESSVPAAALWPEQDVQRASHGITASELDLPPAEALQVHPDTAEAPLSLHERLAAYSYERLTAEGVAEHLLGVERGSEAEQRGREWRRVDHVIGAVTSSALAVLVVSLLWRHLARGSTWADIDWAVIAVAVAACLGAAVLTRVGRTRAAGVDVTVVSTGAARHERRSGLDRRRTTGRPPSGVERRHGSDRRATQRSAQPVGVL